MTILLAALADFSVILIEPFKASQAPTAAAVHGLIKICSWSVLQSVARNHVGRPLVFVLRL